MTQVEQVIDVANYTQLCVWPAVIVQPEEIEQFTKWMQRNMKSRIKYVGQVKTLPTLTKAGAVIPDTGGRNDLFFYVHDDDVKHFAVLRLMAGIQWWEDVLSNGWGYLYGTDFLNEHPKTW